MIAILAKPNSHAAKILNRMEVSDDLRRVFPFELGTSRKETTHQSFSVRDLFSSAIEVAIDRKSQQVGSQHVLLAILKRRYFRDPFKNCKVSYLHACRVCHEFESYGWDSHTPFPLKTIRYLGYLPIRLFRKVGLARKVFWQLSIVNPQFMRNPYPAYARLRKEGLRRDPLLGFWIASRHDDVGTVLRDPRFVRDFAKFVPPELSRDRLPPAIRAELCPIPEYLSNVMLLQDPPRHTRLRGLVSAAFTPRAIAEMGTRIQEITDEMLDRVAVRGEMDLIGDFAYPLPTVVICEMLGVPADDRDDLKRWSDDVAGLLTSTNTIAEDKHGAKAMLEIREYFEGVVANLRRSPKGGLLSAMATAEAAGDKLSEMELYANAILLLAAGHETTTNLIGNGMLALFENPEQLRKLRDDPSIMPTALEELLRYDSPVQWTARIVSEDLEFGGQKIKRGDYVLASIGSANRDTSHFENADRLDLTRADNRHLAFGAGIHFCLGAALARMEGAIAIGTLLRRFPDIRMPPQRISHRKSRPLRGLTQLKVLLR